jgi:uncharacterized protein YdeI (YjbR/CyaY-like superfamily)
VAPVIPDPRRIKSFESESAFEAWLSAHHDSEPDVWIRIHKKSLGLRSVTPALALDVALCWGWIDGLRKGFDERSFLQRYTPRGRKSRWSQINREHVARLVAAGRMTPYGQRQIDAAKADGRWDAAYAPIRATTVSTLPRDLRAAIDIAGCCRHRASQGNLYGRRFSRGAGPAKTAQSTKTGDRSAS